MKSSVAMIAAFYALICKPVLNGMADEGYRSDMDRRACIKLEGTINAYG